MATFSTTAVCAAKSDFMSARTVRAKASPTSSTTQEQSRDEPPSPPPQPPPSPAGWSHPIMDGSLDLVSVSLYYFLYAHTTNTPSPLPWTFKYRIARRRRRSVNAPRHNVYGADSKISDCYRFSLALYHNFGFRFVVRSPLLYFSFLSVVYYPKVPIYFWARSAVMLLLTLSAFPFYVHPGLY
jgi:hypothetical protein